MKQGFWRIEFFKHKENNLGLIILFEGLILTKKNHVKTLFLNTRGTFNTPNDYSVRFASS